MLQQLSKSVMSANDDRQKIDKLREKISKYIRDKEKKRINDSKTVRLLRRVFNACLKKNALVIDVTLTLQSILMIMNKRLSRIEEKDISKISNSSQIKMTIVERTSSAFWAQVARISRIIFKEALRENRRARELIIKIIDDNNKKKLEKTIIKNVAKTLRVKYDIVTSINRLQSYNIRVFTRSQKTKETLQKNIE